MALTEFVTRSDGVRTVLRGAVSGVVTGVLFGAAMLGGAVSTSSLTGPLPLGSTVAGAVLTLLVALVLGSLLGFLLGRRTVTGEAVLWGLLYGALWWFVGPLTLVPLLSRGNEAWDLPAAQERLPSLFGLLLYGAITALLFNVFCRTRPSASDASDASDAGVGLGAGAGVGRWATVRGLVAGLCTASVLRLLLGSAQGLDLAWLLPIGALAGACYPYLLGARHDGAGPALVKGTSYGFLVWLVAAETVPALLRHDGAATWSRTNTLGEVSMLVPYLLLGGGIALVCNWLVSLGEWLFVDDVTKLRMIPPGAWGIRATSYGAAAGLIGGLVFTIVMVAVHELGQVARLVGASAAIAGFIVHLVIAQLIGVSYAVLFRRRGFDLSSGLGWGVCYGFFWWVLGNMTLLPLLTGEPLRYDATALAVGFPSLVGHLAYGAALGCVYYQLEERINPWWFTRSEVEARRAERRRAELLGSAPALWGITVVLALTLSLIITG